MIKRSPLIARYFTILYSKSMTFGIQEGVLLSLLDTNFFSKIRTQLSALLTSQFKGRGHCVDTSILFCIPQSFSYACSVHVSLPAANLI